MVDLAGLQQALQRCGDDALLAVGAVIRGDVDVILREDGAELILQQQEVLGAGTHDGVALAAKVVQLAGDGVGNGQANAAADDGPFALAEVRGAAQGADDVLNVVARVEGREHGGGLADHHEDELNPALRRVPIREGERHALAGLVHANHQELASMGMLGHLRRMDAELEDLL